MAKLIFDIPDDKVAIIVDGWCSQYGYKSEFSEIQFDENENPILDENDNPIEVTIQNPQNKIDFVKEKIRFMIRVETIRGLKLFHKQVLDDSIASDRDEINSINIT